MRRSELYRQNLSIEREKISAILDRYAGILSSDGESQVGNEDDRTNISADAGNINATETPSPITAVQRRTSCATSPNESDPSKWDKQECFAANRFDPRHVYGNIAKRSALCSELAQILSQVAGTGRVNVKVFSCPSS